MIVFPAIDILGGTAVRLSQGDYNRVTVYNEDPVAQAREFAEQGAEWIHVVDLDGAREGVPGNLDVIDRIVNAVGINVEVGGGIRTIGTMRQLYGAGATRLVLGTTLVTDPDFVRAAVDEFGEAVVAGVDARDGEVQIAGWREGARVSSHELVAELRDFGIRHLVYTDIAKDGMQSGINAEAYCAIAAEAGFPVVVSGGVSTIADVRAAFELGPDIVEGVISGRAIYEGTLSVAEMLALAKREG